jgi:chromosome partitioning protein
MKTILASQQKGGCGKTTLISLLSVEAERAGHGPGWLIDADPQGTLRQWHERRQTETPLRAEIAFDDIGKGLEMMRGRGATYCFIDTAPTISGQSAGLIDLADLILIPLTPSPADIWAASETVALVKKAEKPFLFVIMKVKPRANITAQVVAKLSQHGRIAESFIHDRVLYAASLTSGQTAPELEPRGEAAAEVARLWKEVKSSFDESNEINKSARSLKYG